MDRERQQKEEQADIFFLEKMGMDRERQKKEEQGKKKLKKKREWTEREKKEQQGRLTHYCGAGGSGY